MIPSSFRYGEAPKYGTATPIIMRGEGEGRIPVLPRTTPKSVRAQSAGTSRNNSEKDGKYSPERLIERLIQPLHLEAQQNVIQLVSILQTNSRNALLRVEHMKHEMMILRNDCDKTKSELLVAIRNAEIHKTKVLEEREKNNGMKALIDDQQDHAIRTQVLLDRLQHDNLLLKNAFEAMNLSAPQSSEVSTSVNGMRRPGRETQHLDQPYQHTHSLWIVLETSFTLPHRRL